MMGVALVLCVVATLQLASAADEDPLQDFCVANTAAVTLNGRTCKPANTVTAQDFLSTRLRQPATAAAAAAGAPRATVNLASVDTFPGLNTLGLSIARIDFPANGGLNPPHVHPRATEVLFLVQGTLTVGFVSTTNNTLFQSTLSAGDLFVFPRGLPHFQINLDKHNPALAIGALNSQNAGTSQLALALFGANPPLPGVVLQNALGIDQAEVDALIQSVH
jgi:quercetin dioxygenase-like cupin family protein